MKAELIAPCGMNCGVCVRLLAKETGLNDKGFNKTYCEGCIPRGENCLHMGGSCERMAKGLVRFCFECEDFPCKRLKALDKRYSTKYHLSMIQNLNSIKESGTEHFLLNEETKWKCSGCGGTICCHNGLCLRCQSDILLKNKKYRWGEEQE